MSRQWGSFLLRSGWKSVEQKRYVRLSMKNDKCDGLERTKFELGKSVFSVRLMQVGQLETPKTDGDYETGQLFLHKVFAYRGIVLFPWAAKIFDRDVQEQSAVKNENEEIIRRDGRDILLRSQTFYQVLIDSRDSSHVRAQTEAVTFLGTQDGSRSLYAIPGVDYASHDDILPYKISKDKRPIHHELFDKFLQSSPNQEPPYKAAETLKAWQKKNHPWLEISDVHKETTENVRITVIPFYMGSRESTGSMVYWWRYSIRIENLGDSQVQLKERHWKIFSLSGTLETIRGKGVVGQEPIFNKRTPAFQYSSHISLQAPSGLMWGTYRMERDDGYTFDCKIPPFSLMSKVSSAESPSAPPNPTVSAEPVQK